MKENHQMWNHIDTLITKKDLKEDKKIDINIIKEDDGILINVHRTWHHKTTLQQVIIRDQQLLQIEEVASTIHGIKGKQLMQWLTIKD